MNVQEENLKLRKALVEARDHIKELEGFVKEISEGSNSHAYVLKVNGNKVVVSTNSGCLELSKGALQKPKVGDCVLLSSEGIVAGAANEIEGGSVFTVSAAGPDWLEIDASGSPRRILTRVFDKPAEAGDQVLTDPGGLVAIRNYGKSKERFNFDGDTGVSWDDIGGLDVAKDALREAIELPAAHGELFKKYGKRISKGVLLYGPAGCGKTLLAKAAATSLANVFGAKAKSTGFIYVKGPELLDKWVGNTESMIRGLFARARSHKKDHGYPAILFIDEADSLLASRGSNYQSMNQTIVPQFLSEMDGLDESGAFVLLATNRPDILDPAVVRDGRIDRKVGVSRPGRDVAQSVFKIHLRNRPMSKCTSMDEAVAVASNYAYDDRWVIYDVSWESKGQKHVSQMRFRDLISGASLAGIVEGAASRALKRDIAGKSFTGIKKEDLVESISAMFIENLEVNHDLAINDFANGLGGKVVEVQRVTVGS